MVEKCCITDFNDIKFAFKWIIKNFTIHKDDQWLYLQSMPFSFGPNDELKWRLETSPEGYNSRNHLHVSLKLVHCSHGNAPTKFEISILNDRNERTHKRRFPEKDGFRNFYGSGGESYQRLDNFINFDVLLNNANGLLPEDNLTIVCEGTTRLRDVYMFRPFRRPRTDIAKYTSEKFGSLLENQEFSDFTLSVEGKDVGVHKAVLAAQSSVFAAMFKHEMEENKQNRVTICLLYTSPSPRDRTRSRMPSSA